MAPHVMYVGVSDHREFSNADMKKLGVEGDDAKKISFSVNESVEVSDTLLELLTTDPRVKADFVKVTVDEEPESTDEASEDQVADERPLTAAQQAKVAKAAKAAIAKSTPDNPGATPQTTDTTVADAQTSGPTGSSTSGATSN